jgi:two-component system LytT family response regulator
MTPKIRALVADDEAVTRAHIVALLRQERDIDVVRECCTGTEAQQALADTLLDFVILDIEMPGLDGLSLARMLRAPRAPVVVFVTAHHEYAVNAFEVRALDYLLKPFTLERFRSMLGRARAQVALRRLEAAPSHERPRDRPRHDRFTIKSGGRIHVVHAAEIDWCEACGNYVGLHIGPRCHLVRDTMARVDARLDPRQFMRIHRSAIVNVDRVQEMRPTFSGEYVVTLRGGTRLTLSRGYRGALRGRLGAAL